MDTILLLTRLALAGVFLLAGVTKLADLAGSRKAMREFGVPVRFAREAGIALPVVELAIAVLLVPRVTAWWGALAALVLLLAFVTGIANVMRQGRAPECHCFGQVHSEPVGWSTLARNGVLAALSLLIVAQGPNDAGPGLAGWWSDLGDAVQVAVVLGTLSLGLFASLGWALLQVMRQNGRLLLRLDALEAAVAAKPEDAPKQPPTIGLPAGSPAPPFRLPDLDGVTRSYGSLRDPRKPLALIFIDVNCGPCGELMPDIALWQRDLADRLNVVVIGHGDTEALRAKTRPFGVSNVLVQDAWEVAESYHSLPTPSAVIIEPNGLTTEGGVAGTAAIRQLIATRASAPHPPSGNGTPPPPAGLEVGAAAPDVQLPALDGETVSLADFRGEPAMVLFWNPQCGFCNRMLPRLQAWEADPPEGAPRLFVISRGSVEDNLAQGLRAPVVLDQEVGTLRAFGAAGTPSAVLIDAGGKIASRVAVGADAVLALAGSPGQPVS